MFEFTIINIEDEIEVVNELGERAKSMNTFAHAKLKSEDYTLEEIIVDGVKAGAEAHAEVDDVGAMNTDGREEEVFTCGLNNC